MDSPIENSQLNPKKLEEYQKERISYTSAHHIRHNNAKMKKASSGYKRTCVKAIIHTALTHGNLEELSTSLLKSSLIPYQNYYKPGAETLKTIVERKIKKRIETHGARKKGSASK